MLRQDVFPSRFFKAGDLPEPQNLRIMTAQMETLRSPQGLTERKLVLTFEDHPKCLAVNRTNFDVVSQLHGSNTDNWIGKTVQLFATKTFVRGQEVDCVRVRAAG
jgi:hypothetical protein